ncbi:hypothetical protein THAOC_34587 [Thalassiosira oceanica]|uniref:Uncharacterized protein n=1 Tax=Thalassiosira oceanica TaxID=159749 RepID=K0RJ96_THAOC|nr:hypothetical protein THAOC_34587 [Thalassiosira oceanica]|eukprot:EJK46727.1 hypothetical protein THAOC_34587 [Thalassiosira oceanica]
MLIGDQEFVYTQAFLTFVLDSLSCHDKVLEGTARRVRDAGLPREVRRAGEEDKALRRGVPELGAPRGEAEEGQVGEVTGARTFDTRWGGERVLSEGRGHCLFSYLETGEDGKMLGPI